MIRRLLLSAIGLGIGMLAAGCGTLRCVEGWQDVKDCGSYPDRQDFGTFRVITTCAKRVSEHCKKRIRLTNSRYDNGDEVKVGDEVRACTDYKNPKKPTIFRSRKYRVCDKHEAGHAKFEGPAAWVEANRACLGESK